MTQHEPPDPTTLGARIVSGDRVALARAITLAESRKAEHRAAARTLLHELLPRTGAAHRIGITGAPGVGKSTLIDAFGTWLTARGRRVAVLAVDPSSRRTGGSILGDKTRMARLAVDPDAFVRPSPSAGALGGVAARTRETMVLVEAGGFDVVIVETVGVGQSETAVADLVDLFLVLALSGAGDELQGIKKGVVELADLIAVNKADGDNLARARAAAAEYRAALHILTPASAVWSPPVLLVSGLTGAGLPELWEQVALHRARTEAAGEFAAKRRRQQVGAFRALLEERAMQRLTARPEIRVRLAELEAAVAAGRVTPEVAVQDIAAAMGL